MRPAAEPVGEHERRLDGPLSAGEFVRLQRLARRLPRPWIENPRRRRFLFLALAAPGFFAVFSTPLHQNLAALILGFVLFAAATGFRGATEGVFARAEAAQLWPPASLPSPAEDRPHA